MKILHTTLCLCPKFAGCSKDERLCEIIISHVNLCINKVAGFRERYGYLNGKSYIYFN